MTCPACHNPNCDGYCMANMAGEPGNIRRTEVEGEWHPPDVDQPGQTVYPVFSLRRYLKAHDWAIGAIAAIVVYCLAALGAYHIWTQPKPPAKPVPGCHCATH